MNVHRRIMFVLLLFVTSLSLANAEGIPNAIGNSLPVQSSDSSEDLPLILKYALSEAQGQEHDNYHFQEVANQIVAINPANQLDISYADGTATVHYDQESFSLSLSQYGYSDSMQTVETIDDSSITDNRLELMRGDLREWYVNGTQGFQQGFTLERAPSSGAGLLQIDMLTGGSLSPSLAGGTLNWQNSAGHLQLTYSGLMAYDADGTELPAHMTIHGNSLSLLVDDTHATYPLTIDPVIQEAKLLPADGAAGDLFAYSVSLDGDTALIGARSDDDKGSNSGSAYVFRRTGGVWAQEAKLLPADGAASDFFGWSVSLDGDTALIGAFGDDDEKGSNSGSAYIFRRTGGVWAQEAKLLPADGAASDIFRRR